MKKTNAILSAVLILLVLCGWVVQLKSINKTDAQYFAYLQQAKEYNEAGLYQKAFRCYEDALQIEDTREVRELWIDSYAKAFSDKAVTLNAYVSALSVMCDLYADEAVYWENIIAVQMENGKVSNAYDTYKEFQTTGLSSMVIDGYKNDILYQYNMLRKPYMEFVRNTTGYYTVRDGQGWGVLRPNGETVYQCIYEYISPYNSNYEALFVSEKGQRIVDAETIVQAKINIGYLRTGTWTNGLLPVCDPEGEWYYLNCSSNEKVHGSYTMASNYASGIAAVNNGDEWVLVDARGNTVNGRKFSDIKLHGNGDYQFDGIMIAAEKGQYGIYSAKGELLCDLMAEDMDIYFGGYIAYRDKASGQWGMVTREGEKVINPSFTEAKSFSNHFAAVSNGELWGFVNMSGELIIDYQFFEADYFTSGGMCAVSASGKDYVFIKLRHYDE